MVFTRLVTASLAATLAASYLVAPPETAFPGTVSQCSGWVEGQTGLSCTVVEEALGVTTIDFETWVKETISSSFVDIYEKSYSTRELRMLSDIMARILWSTCELLSGYDYCIQIDFGSTSTVATSTTSSSSPTSTTLVTTTSSTGDGISTPLPIQTGMVSTCDKFYLVVSGDTCQAIANAAPATQPLLPQLLTVPLPTHIFQLGRSLHPRKFLLIRRPTSGQSSFVHTPSITPPSFPIVVTPTVGGNTTVIGGSTTTISSVSYASGNYTYFQPPWVAVFGGITSVVNGATLAPTTTTVTPYPHPTTTDNSTDTQMNSKSTIYSSTSTSGGPKTSADSSDSKWKCHLYCHYGCPLCPPGSGGDGGRGGGSDGSGDDSNTQTESSTSSSTSDESAAFTVFAMGTTYFADPLPTTEALDAQEAIASAEADLMQSLYGAEISFAETATNTMVTPTPAATTTSPTGFAYTYTESNGDIVACPTEILVDLNGNTYASTVCVSPTTIGTAAPTYIFTSTQSGGATLGYVSDLVLLEASQSPSTICVALGHCQRRSGADHDSIKDNITPSNIYSGRDSMRDCVWVSFRWTNDTILYQGA
ncbi:hypothetical protein TMatcc_001839 [Talaromyces marneffei ATCC 18224]